MIRRFVVHSSTPLLHPFYPPSPTLYFALPIRVPSFCLPSRIYLSSVILRWRNRARSPGTQARPGGPACPGILRNFLIRPFYSLSQNVPETHFLPAQLPNTSSTTFNNLLPPSTLLLLNFYYPSPIPRFVFFSSTLLHRFAFHPSLPSTSLSPIPGFVFLPSALIR